MTMTAPRLTRRQCLGAGLGALPLPALAAPARIGEVVEWPALKMLDGTALAPSAWHGVAAVVVFWATFCPFCKRHNAHLDKLQRSLAGRPMRVIGVALDRDEGAVRRYMAANGYQFAVTLDAEPLRSRLTARRVIPMTCVIDRQGRLRQAIPGEMFEEDMLELANVAFADRG